MTSYCKALLWRVAKSISIVCSDRILTIIRCWQLQLLNAMTRWWHSYQENKQVILNPHPMLLWGLVPNIETCSNQSTPRCLIPTLCNNYPICGRKWTVKKKKPTHNAHINLLLIYPNNNNNSQQFMRSIILKLAGKCSLVTREFKLASLTLMVVQWFLIRNMISLITCFTKASN